MAEGLWLVWGGFVEQFGGAQRLLGAHTQPGAAASRVLSGHVYYGDPTQATYGALLIFLCL